MPKVFRVFAAVMLTVFLCVPNAGCTKDEVALNAYKTLETSAETYKAVMNAAQDLHRMGKMTDEQWNQVRITRSSTSIRTRRRSPRWSSTLRSRRG